MHRARQADDDAGVDDERHAVADAALGDLFAEPHDETRPGRQREHRHQPESPAGVVHQRQAARDFGLPLEEDGDAERLHEAQADRAVAGVLRDLAPSQLAFLRQPLEVRPDHGQELKDDRRADIRHDAQREDRHLRQVSAREHVVEAEHRVGRLARELLERGRVDARRRNVAAHAEHGQHAQREQHAVPEIRNGEDVLQTVHNVTYRVLPTSFRRAAGGGDFFGRLPAELVRADGQRLADVAAREHLDEPVCARHEAALEQQLRRHDGAGVKPGAERVEVHDLGTRRGTDCEIRASARGGAAASGRLRSRA